MRTVVGVANRGCTPTIIVMLRGWCPITWGTTPSPLRGPGGLPFPSPGQHPVGASSHRAKREWRPCKKQASGRQDPAGKVWLSVEEAINLWELENSSKEEMLEAAAPPLPCRPAAGVPAPGSAPSQEALAMQRGHHAVDWVPL